jgi:hypothetical protein
LLFDDVSELARWLESVSVPHRNSFRNLAWQFKTVNEVECVLVI